MKKIILTLVALVMCIAAGAQSLTPKQDAKKGTWGYVNVSGKWVVKPKYDAAGPYEQRPSGQLLAIVEEKGLKGFIDERGKSVGEGLKYTDIIIEGDNAPIVTLKNGKKGIMGYDGTYYVKPEIDAITPMGADGYVVMVKDKAGLVGLDGTIKIEPKDFTNIERFGDTGMWLVSKRDKKGVFRLGDKKPFISCDYASINPVPEPIGSVSGYKVTSQKGGIGYVRTDGKNICRPNYKQIVPWGDGQYYVEELSGVKAVWFPAEGVMLLIDRISIDRVGPINIYAFKLNPEWEKYPTLYARESKVASEYYPSKQGRVLIDGHGKRFLSVETILDSPLCVAKSSEGYNVYEDTVLLAEGLRSMPCKQGDLYTVGNDVFKTEGGKFVKADVKAINYYEGGFSGSPRILYLIKGADGLYDLYTYYLKALGMKAEDGKQIVKCDLVALKKDGTWQLWNITDQVKVTDCDEDEPLKYFNDRGIFKLNGKYGFIRLKKGNYPHDYEVEAPAEYDRIVPLRGDYDRAQDFVKMAILTKGGKSWVCDFEHGREFNARPYEALEQSSCNLLDFIGTINGRKGIYAYDGIEKVAPKYNDIEAHKNGKNVGYVVTVNGKKGFVDAEYNERVKPVYDDIEVRNDGGYPGYVVTVNGKKGFVAADSEETIKPVYDDLKWDDKLSLYEAWKNGARTLWSQAGREWSGNPEAILDDWDASSNYLKRFGVKYHRYLKVNGDLLVRFAKNQPVKAVVELTLNGKALPKYKETINFTPYSDRDEKFFIESFDVEDQNWPLDKKGLGWTVTIYDLNGKVIGKESRTFHFKP